MAIATKHDECAGCGAPIALRTYAAPHSTDPETARYGVKLWTAGDGRYPGDQRFCESSPDGASDHRPSGPLDVWLRIPDGEEESEAEANTYAAAHDCYRVDWSLTAVGLVKSHVFATLADAHAWLRAEGFEDYTP